MENQIEDAASSSRSKKAPSIASSRKTMKIRKIQKTQDDLRSRAGGDSNRDKSERKENINANLSLNAISQNSQQQQLNIIPLYVEPEREIPDDERIMRDRKER